MRDYLPESRVQDEAASARATLRQCLNHSACSVIDDRAVFAPAAYAHAFALRDGFPAETAYQLACCYAQLDELSTARDWLQRALDLGLRNLAQVQTDDALDYLREDDEIRERSGLMTSTGVT